MSKTAFEYAIDFTIPAEVGHDLDGGGYTNDPTDPGGETKYGIAKHSHPDVDIKNLTLDQAKAIYFDEYWLRNRCDTMSLGLSVAYFDTCVNLGGGRAWGLLVDSRASQSMDDLAAVSLLLNERRDYYTDLVNKRSVMGKYLKGWLSRVEQLRDYCEGIVGVAHD